MSRLEERVNLRLDSEVYATYSAVARGFGLELPQLLRLVLDEHLDEMRELATGLQAAGDESNFGFYRALLRHTRTPGGVLDVLRIMDEFEDEQDRANPEGSEPGGAAAAPLRSRRGAAA